MTASAWDLKATEVVLSNIFHGSSGFTMDIPELQMEGLKEFGLTPAQVDDLAEEYKRFLGLVAMKYGNADPE